jgi:heme-degrading monooxygenase HmoA
MIVSILTRKTRTKDRSQWEGQVKPVLPRIMEVLEAQPGFLQVEYLWALEDDGEVAQVTRWKTAEDCRRYVREGAAAMVATIEDAAVPTAPHPEGAWVRRTYEAAP